MNTPKRPHRLEKVNQLLKEELGQLILKELDLDKNLFLTITRVDTSSDFTHATVFFSTLVRSGERMALHALEKNVGAIQRLLNRKLRMRPVPRIRFAPDALLRKEERLYDLLSTSHDTHS